ncbi:hypothetical protein CTI12_AA573990 [Artemisia annua]|uniref:Uncharacterized protein n=1 Tax=Artemisia annua TaxID=35608 RepID=A0A2U1KQS9_ARTAN|nr:hypothetical protein CTI12_AA573990 [Artemisia annua]
MEVICFTLCQKLPLMLGVTVSASKSERRDNSKILGRKSDDIYSVWYAPSLQYETGYAEKGCLQWQLKTGCFEYPFPNFSDSRPYSHLFIYVNHDYTNKTRLYPAKTRKFRPRPGNSGHDPAIPAMSWLYPPGQNLSGIWRLQSEILVTCSLRYQLSHIIPNFPWLFCAAGFQFGYLFSTLQNNAISGPIPAAIMTSIERPSFFVPLASRYLGHEPHCTPYWPQAVIWALLYKLPEAAIDAWG